MKKNIMQMFGMFLAFGCIYLMTSMCVQAQETTAALPRPQEVGQFFAYQNGKLTPLFEEKKVSAHMLIGITVSIHGANSPVVLPGSDDLKFIIHLPDKTIRFYNYEHFESSGNKRKAKIEEDKYAISHSTAEYADGYFVISPKARLVPGEYVFFTYEGNNVDNFYSFSVK
jgi:hypothetical protein